MVNRLRRFTQKMAVENRVHVTYSLQSCTRLDRLSERKHINQSVEKHVQTRMWANVQRDGRPAKYRWNPLFNAAKFG